MLATKPITLHGVSVSCIKTTRRLIHCSIKITVWKQKLHSFGTTLKLENHGSVYSKTKDMTVRSSAGDRGAPLASDGSSDSWKAWIVGVLFTIALYFARNKRWPLLQLQDKVEIVIETAENVTEIVEKVADEVEQVAEKVAEHMPEGGRTREAVKLVENIAKEAAKDAHLAKQVIDKIEVIEGEVAKTQFGTLTSINEGKVDSSEKGTEKGQR